MHIFIAEFYIITELRMREADRERQKREWEMKERQAEEQRTREEELRRRQQEEMAMRIRRQEEELHRRQQENNLFMQVIIDELIVTNRIMKLPGMATI